jgi:hypothetical protein
MAIPPPTFSGRTLGFTILVSSQLAIGSIHVLFGLWFLSIPRIVPFFGSTAFNSKLIYGFYTVAYGLLTLIFTVALWARKTIRLIGTIGICISIITVDSLTLLNLPDIPGIPTFAAVPEIAYSLFVLLFFSA